MVKQSQEPSDTEKSVDDRLDQLEATYFNAEKTGADPTNSGPEKIDAVDKAQAIENDIAQQGALAAQSCADELGELLHTKFIQLLAEKVRDNKGQLSASDIVDMGDEFRKEIVNIKDAFVKAVESYAMARQKKYTSQTRSNLFHRLLVRNFERQFTDEKTLEKRPDMLSRRMLPGFFNMMMLMFGKPKLAEYEKRMTKLIERLQRDREGEIEWEDIYNAPEARKISLRAEVEIAQYFRDVDKRLSWMVAMVNSNLIPPPDNRTGTAWVFNEEAAKNMLGGLFSDLRLAMNDQNSREAFAKQMGLDVVENLDTVVERFS